jgi:LDH2 family malate/lactate/ureidoglycolate dehydrogenase
MSFHPRRGIRTFEPCRFMSEPRQQPVTRSLAELKPALLTAISHAGYTEPESELIFQEFAEAEILGMPDYGLASLPRFLELDGFKTRSDSRLATTGTVTTLDAGGRAVHVFQPQLLAALCDGVANHGVHMAGIRNCTSWVRGGTATYRIAQRGLVGLCFLFTNFKVSKIPGMTTPELGINVLSIAVPSARTPFVYDVGLAAMTLRKIEAAKRRRDPARPYAIGLDADGNPTGEAEQVAFPMPMAGERGMGLTLAVQLLAGAMLGFDEVVALEQYKADNGILLIAIDPSNFSDADAFTARVERWLGDLVSGSDSLVHVPGQKYRRLEQTDLDQFLVTINPDAFQSLGVYL